MSKEGASSTKASAPRDSRPSHGLAATDAVKPTVVGPEGSVPAIPVPQDAKGSPLWTLHTDFLVMVNHYDHDVSWASELRLPHIIYEKNRPAKEPLNAGNQGKSESNLLKFVWQFYDQLPRNLITVHQYRRKGYLDRDLVHVLNDPHLAARYAASPTAGFWNFNTFILGDAEPQVRRMLASGWWPSTMEPWFGGIHGYGNFTRGKRGCAQFIVSRERLRSLPREFYRKMYAWIQGHTIDTIRVGYDPRSMNRLPMPSDSHPNSNYYISRYLEWTWELIFTAVKKTEQPAGIDVGTGTRLVALYGARSYFCDVTPRVVQQFVRAGHLRIPKNVDFNSVFYDVVYGTRKLLVLNVNGRPHELPEERMADFECSVA